MISDRPGDGSWRPGMQRYEIVWMRDSKEIYRHLTYATNEADAITAGEAAFAGHIKQHVQCDLEGTTVAVRAVQSPAE